MPSLDPRIVRLSIQIGNQLKVFEDLAIAASGSKFANPLQNECEINVSNLSREDRAYLITETSPFNPSRTRKGVILEAGRVSTGLSRIFVGDITSCQPSQPPDIVLTIKAKTGEFNKRTLVSRTGAAVAPLSRIAGEVAKDLGLQLVFEALDKNISSYAFTGSALKQVEQLGRAGGVNAFIDDQMLVVKNRGAELQNVTSVLSAESGMVGIPELTEEGVKVTYLLDSTSRLGGRLTIDSKLNPAANGEFVIYKLNFDIATHDTPWYYTAESQRKNYAAEAKPKKSK